MLRYYQVICKKCGKKQMYECRSRSPAKKMKVCVYCEKRFCVHTNVNNTQIIKERDGKRPI